MFNRASRAADEIFSQMKQAYAEIDKAYDDSSASLATGRYDGLKSAYLLLTGRDVVEVSQEVVGWYISTPEYQEAKKGYEV